MTSRSVLAISFVLLALMLLGGYSFAQNYVPKPNEECYGTWINDKSINQGHIQKKICSADGNKDFLEVDGSSPLFEDEQHIYSKWIDPDKNIWYKTYGTVRKGAYLGTKWQELDKLSKGATVWEYVFVIVSQFDASYYPAKVDPKDTYYRVFYRSQ
jgi:poly-D-alanine transfer protein DltD